jgi:hypothetical protein
MAVAYVPRGVTWLHCQVTAEPAFPPSQVPQLARTEAPQLGLVHLQA